MKKIEEKAVAFAKSIWEDYLINRDLLKLTSVFDDNASYIGTGDGEICYSLEQVRTAILGETEEWNGHFTIDDQWNLSLFLEALTPMRPVTTHWLRPCTPDFP